MDLMRTSWHNNENYSAADGSLSHKEENANYNVVDDGEIIGSVTISADNNSGEMVGSASINIGGFASLEEGVTLIKSLLHIEG